METMMTIFLPPKLMSIDIRFYIDIIVYDYDMHRRKRRMQYECNIILECEYRGT